MLYIFAAHVTSRGRRGWFGTSNKKNRKSCFPRETLRLNFNRDSQRRGHATGAGRIKKPMENAENLLQKPRNRSEYGPRGPIFATGSDDFGDGTAQSPRFPGLLERHRRSAGSRANPSEKHEVTTPLPVWRHMYPMGRSSRFPSIRRVKVSFARAKPDPPVLFCYSKIEHLLLNRSPPQRDKHQIFDREKKLLLEATVEQ